MSSKLHCTAVGSGIAKDGRSLYKPAHSATLAHTHAHNYMHMQTQHTHVTLCPFKS